MKRTFLLISVGMAVVIGLQTTSAKGQGVVPGTGSPIDYVGDDFEDPDWQYVSKGPKSSREIDGQTRSPKGYSANRRWFEGPERGDPDVVKIIPTPENGLPGSQYALLMRTLHSGVPGRLTSDVQQDDLIVDCVTRLGTGIRPAETPNCVVRVYLPPAEQWENRSGPHFGFRIGLSATTKKPREGLFAMGSETTSEPYWPGMWIHFRSKTDPKVETDSAFIKIRGDRRGRDFQVLEIEQFGWWTLGMSVTGDGMVHYYAHAGVEPLTAQDHITSQYPYSFRAEQFRTFFFNICNRNDGKSWSTPFVIDDPQLFLVNASRIQSIVERKQQQTQRNATAKRSKSSQGTNRNR